ncbi:MAG: hypothetical protein OIF34_13560, partial [Porticoccaceae bacterium]|nr:hypothetical protein [Porticoccaceae bacterium]
MYSYTASDIPNNPSSSLGRIELSKGWISAAGGATVGADNYRPDFNEPARSIYGGLKWVTKNNGGVYEYNVGLFGDDLRANGWIACAVNAFSPTYRGHSLGTGWTTGPFSHQPYIDPNGFAQNPPADGLAYRRLNNNESSGNFMDYLVVNQLASGDFYESPAPGWYYRAKDRKVDMLNLGDG